MIRTLAAGVMGIALVSMTPLAASAAHEPNNGHCASQADYHKVHKGQTVSKVKHELGSKGKVQSSSHSGGYADQIRNYNTCGQFDVITIGFDKKPGGQFVVDAKDGVFGG